MLLFKSSVAVKVKFKVVSLATLGATKVVMSAFGSANITSAPVVSDQFEDTIDLPVSAAAVALTVTTCASIALEGDALAVTETI